MKDLTRFGCPGRKQQKRTDSDQVLKDKTKSSEFRKGMKPALGMPGYGDPEPDPILEENNN